MSLSVDKQLEKVRVDLFNLVSSPLYNYRVENGYLPVIGEGSNTADIMLIGEAPGKNEAISGRPFCGAAGRTLDEILESVYIKRKDVYITNIVKDRPQKNRDPLPEEIEIYAPFLDTQIELIQPKVIVPLGRYAMGYIMKKFGLESSLEPIGKAHGKIYTAKTSYGEISILPQYHPAATIYNRALLPILKRDFEVLGRVIHSR